MTPRLIIANNTKTTLGYNVKITENWIDIFRLGPNDRKVYENLISESIYFVKLNIYSEQDKLLASHDYIDVNAYVSMYGNGGSDKIKFAIYYEPDIYFDSMDPTVRMINDVEKMLHKYLNSHDINLSFKDFLKSLLFKDVGWTIIENDTDPYNLIDLSKMRPSMYKKSIEIIFNKLS